MRYLYKYLDYDDRQNYVKYGSPTLITCLVQVGLNLMYSNKNGIELTKAQLQLLKKHKKNIVKLITAKTEKDQKKALTNKLIDVLLSVLLPVVKKHNIG